MGRDVVVAAPHRLIRSVKDKIRAVTRATSQQPARAALIRLNQIMHGCAGYFKDAVCKHTLESLENFVWHRVIRWWMRLHRWKRNDVRRHLTGPHGRWQAVGGRDRAVQHRQGAGHPVSIPRQQDPQPRAMA